jgi:hypothetical protein
VVRRGQTRLVGSSVERGDRASFVLRETNNSRLTKDQSRSRDEAAEPLRNLAAFPRSVDDGIPDATR